MDLTEKVKAEVLALVKSKESVFLTCSDLDITFQTVLLSFARQKLILKNTVPKEYIRSFVNSSSYELRVSMVKFVAETIDSDGKDIFFPLVGSSKIDEIRTDRRMPIASRDQVEVEFINPVDGLTPLSKKVLEISDSGLSLALDFDSQLFAPGSLISHLKVMKNHKLQRVVEAKVIYKRKLMTSKGRLIYQAGLRFET